MNSHCYEMTVLILGLSKMYRKLQPDLCGACMLGLIQGQLMECLHCCKCPGCTLTTSFEVGSACAGC